MDTLNFSRESKTIDLTLSQYDSIITMKRENMTIPPQFGVDWVTVNRSLLGKNKLMVNNMTTKKLYLEDTYQFHFEGLVQEVGKDKKGIFIIFDQTVFYPQGGGQPADHGVIKNDHLKANVVHIAQHGDQIRHYLKSTISEALEAQKVYGAVDQKKRLINARYHTASHLLSNIVEILNPKLKTMKSHSFPGEAYVEFQGDEAIDVGMLQNAINAVIAKK
jgi:alanyl-tRNA synthetase